MAQTISYEISLALIFIALFVRLPVITLRALYVFTARRVLPFLAAVVLGWVITAVAETNRTPFDFAEGESELVSGFNVEYGAGGFALIFIAEYAIILLLRTVTRICVGAQGLTT